MITNERQYRITKRQLSRLKKALRDFNVLEVTDRLHSEILAASEMNALKSEEIILINQLKEYELLCSGKITQFEASNLGELPKILIRARIAQGLTQRELGAIVGLKEQQIQRYESDEYAAASLRRLQSIAVALKLNITEIAELNIDNRSSDAITTQDLDWSRFPIREMYRRQWFEGFSGSLDAALEEVDTLIPSLSINLKPVLALHRRQVRASSIPDDYSLLAWEYRILSLAAKVTLGCSYKDGVIDSQWVSELIKKSEKPDGPLLAKEQLEKAGIAMIVEPHLAGMHLDGAAILSDRGPVIGLTLRYDRLDNFWFVLLHELFHVINHLCKRKLENIFDDLDSDSTDILENEADSLASEALIPEKIWECSLSRYIRSFESVIATANELRISPAIVAGRIRYEANNYVILNELIGQGEVRKHFPEAGFGN